MRSNISTSSRQDGERMLATITGFIQQKVQDRSVLIGLSGGIDSSLSCALAVRALGRGRVKSLIVKNMQYTEKHLAVARRYTKRLGVEVIEINTDPVRNAVLNHIPFVGEGLREVATVDARITDLVLRTAASCLNLIYLGSINGTERLTGWYPKGALFGDYCPIGGLLKTQVKQLAYRLDLPAQIIETVSEDAGHICSGCGELPEFRGIAYADLDKILLAHETGNIARVITEIPDVTIKMVLKRIEAVGHKERVFCEYPVINEKVAV
ncbi:NAD(+) synthase [Patescibacteria group bacterium]|nr:NAD(+) synthase [Patescibacteria group bacterium]